VKPAGEKFLVAAVKTANMNQVLLALQILLGNSIIRYTAMVTSGPPALVGLFACSLQLPLPVMEPSRGAEGLLSFAEPGRPGSSFCFLWSSSIPR